MSFSILLIITEYTISYFIDSPKMENTKRDIEIVE